MSTMSKLKRKKSAVDNYRPEQHPVTKKTSETLCRVQESHCSKTLKDSSAAEVVSWWERSELSDVERIWALTLKALCPSLQTHQEESIAQLPPPSSTLPQRAPVEKVSDWKWSIPDENTDLPDLPTPSFLIHQPRVSNPTSHLPALKDIVESEPVETNQTNNPENCDVSTNQEGVSLCDLQTMQHHHLEVHVLLDKRSNTFGPAGQVSEQSGKISGADGSGSGLTTKSRPGGSGSGLKTKAGVGESVSELRTISGEGGSGLKTKSGAGGSGSEFGTKSGAGGSGSGLKTKVGVGQSVSELRTISGAGGSGSGLKTKAGIGESVSELRTISGSGGSGLKTKLGAGGSGSEFGTKSGAGGSGSGLKIKVGVGESVSELRTISEAGGSGSGLKTKSGARGSGSEFGTKSGAGGSGSGQKAKMATGGSKSLFGTKSAGAGRSGSVLGTKSGPVGSASGFGTKSGSGLSLEKPGAGGSELRLECCPMCLMPFPAGFSQMECDGHLAQCLSEMNADIVW